MSLSSLEIKRVREKSKKEKRKRKPIPQKIKDQVWNRDGGACVECGSKEQIQFDHIIPHSKNGPDTYPNLQLLCKYCNVRKRDKIVKKGQINNDIHKQVKKLKRYIERKEKEIDEINNEYRVLNTKFRRVKKESIKPPKNATEVYNMCIDDIHDYIDDKVGTSWGEICSDEFFDNLSELIDKKIKEYDLYSWPYPDWMLNEYKNDDGEILLIDNQDWEEEISTYFVEFYMNLEEDLDNTWYLNKKSEKKA
jgi:hypothetical protein